MPVFVKPIFVAALIAAVGVWVGVSPSGQGATSPAAQPAPAEPHPQLDATSDAEARQMRAAVMTLARQAAVGLRCDPNAPSAQYRPCVVPALRHLGIGGRMGANVLNVVIAHVPVGNCRGYLLGLQGAMEGAGEDARWLLPQLYERGRRRAQHEISSQIHLIAAMLRHAATAAPAYVCSVGADGPAL
jgi:hypothetical protein